MVPENPETKAETPAPSATSKLIEDAAPTPAASGPGPAPIPDKVGPPGLDRSDGFVHIRLSPEGSQLIPGRPNHATSRGPNATIPLKRLGLTYDSSPEDVLKAVAKYAELPRAELDGCVVFTGTSKMNAFEVHRPMPGETELRPGTFDARMERIS